MSVGVAVTLCFVGCKVLTLQHLLNCITSVGSAFTKCYVVRLYGVDQVQSVSWGRICESLFFALECCRSSAGVSVSVRMYKTHMLCVGGVQIAAEH